MCSIKETTTDFKFNLKSLLFLFIYLFSMIYPYHFYSNYIVINTIHNPIIPYSNSIGIFS